MGIFDRFKRKQQEPQDWFDVMGLVSRTSTGHSVKPQSKVSALTRLAYEIPQPKPKRGRPKGSKNKVPK